MASNLTGQVRNILKSLPPWRAVTCRAKITVDVRGEILESKTL